MRLGLGGEDDTAGGADADFRDRRAVRGLRVVFGFEGGRVGEEDSAPD
jgi:hypothetical protein